MDARACWAMTIVLSVALPAQIIPSGILDGKLTCGQKARILDVSVDMCLLEWREDGPGEV
jgi:hypothetical protein